MPPNALMAISTIQVTDDDRVLRTAPPRPPKFSQGALFDPHDDDSSDFRKYVGMRTMIIVATVAFGAMRLMLRRLSPAQRLELAGEWTADE
jgi:hypothetical protein